MKRLILTAIMMMIAAGSTVAADRPISNRQLPKRAQTFIQDYWPNVATVSTEKTGATYEVVMDEGSTLIFNAKGYWISIENAFGFPNHFLPERIGLFIHSRYPDSYIAAVSRHQEGYTVVLNTGLTLHYDRDGNIERVDD